MKDLMVGEIMTGIGDSGVRCGVIGEIGCSWPLTSTERRALEAAALAQKETGKEITCSLQAMLKCGGVLQCCIHLHRTSLSTIRILT